MGGVWTAAGAVLAAGIGAKVSHDSSKSAAKSAREQIEAQQKIALMRKKSNDLNLQREQRGILESRNAAAVEVARKRGAREAAMQLSNQSKGIINTDDGVFGVDDGV